MTSENQAQADRRISLLLSLPANVWFVSVEPMLGPVDLATYLTTRPEPIAPHGQLLWARYRRLKCIICGPETGPGGRPFNPAWARDLRDQCQSGVVPFFYKGKEPPKDLRVFEEPTPPPCPARRAAAH